MPSETLRSAPRASSACQHMLDLDNSPAADQNSHMTFDPDNKINQLIYNIFYTNMNAQELCIDDQFRAG